MDTWTTRDGRVVKLVDMGSEHLCNTIRYLRRRYAGIIQEMGACASFPTQGDAASDAQESAMHEFDRVLDDYSVIIESMEKEAKRRGIVL